MSIKRSFNDKYVLDQLKYSFSFKQIIIWPIFHWKWLKPYFENIQTTTLQSTVHEMVIVDKNFGGLYKQLADVPGIARDQM